MPRLAVIWNGDMREAIHAILPYSRTITVKLVGGKRLQIRDEGFFRCIIIGDPIVVPDKYVHNPEITPDSPDPDEEYFQEEINNLTSDKKSDMISS